MFGLSHCSGRGGGWRRHGSKKVVVARASIPPTVLSRGSPLSVGICTHRLHSKSIIFSVYPSVSPTHPYFRSCARNVVIYDAPMWTARERTSDTRACLGYASCYNTCGCTNKSQTRCTTVGFRLHGQGPYSCLQHTPPCL